MSLTQDEQIEVMRSLGAKATAWLTGVGHETSIRGNTSIPRNEDGVTYNAKEVCRYMVEERRRRKREQGEVDALEAKRRLEAEKLTLDILRIQKRLVPVEETQEFFGELLQNMRSFGEVLQRDYGSEALLLLNELLAGMEANVDRWVETIQDKDE